MSEKVLETVAYGACWFAAPGAVDCFDDAREMNAYAEVMHETMDPENTWEDVEEVGETMDRFFSPLRQARALWRALRG